jgi:hypothetical protein
MNEKNKKFIGKALKKAGELLDDGPSEQALLIEYRACQHENNAIETSYWTMASIFIGISSALLIGLIYSVFANQELLQVLLKQLSGERLEIHFFQTLILVVGMLIVLLLSVIRLWLRRVNFLQQINSERMRDIERQLGIWKSWRVHGVDHWNIENYDFDNEITEKNRLMDYKPKNWWHNWRAGRKNTLSIDSYSDLIFSVLIFLWLYPVFTIAIPIKFPLGIVSIIAVGIVDYFIIRFTRVKKKE